MTEDSLIYLYCVAKEVPQLTDIEHFADSLYSVCHEGLHAVVSKVGESEFNEENLKRNLANPDWVRARVTDHERIVEGVMQSACVIPFKFGTIFRTEDRLRTMLAEHAYDLVHTIEKLEGTEEWGVKIFCDREKLEKSLITEIEGLSQIDKLINSSAPGKVFFLRKKREELIDSAAKEAIRKCGQESVDMLSRRSIAIRRNELLPREATPGRDEMILNVAFLVEKSRVTRFLLVLDDLKVRYSHKGLSFDCTGPWPPYNFCQLSEGRAQYG
ncbi:MAG: GvpL/GvpF family gas vesicle protein [Candidatus Zixiibacteriota bacterium]